MEKSGGRARLGKRCAQAGNQRAKIFSAGRASRSWALFLSLVGREKVLFARNTRAFIGLGAYQWPPNNASCKLYAIDRQRERRDMRGEGWGRKRGSETSLDVGGGGGDFFSWKEDTRGRSLFLFIFFSPNLKESDVASSLSLSRVKLTACRSGTTATIRSRYFSL